MSLVVEFNTTDYNNIVANFGEPSENLPGEAQIVAVDDVQRGLIRVFRTDDGETDKREIPLVAVDPSFAIAALTDEERAEAIAAAQDDIDAMLSAVTGTPLDELTWEMNPAELARTVEILGEPSFIVTPNDEIPLGCVRIGGGEITCAPEAGLGLGSLAYAEDGVTLVVTTGDVNV